jgi:hypothetical protein
MACAVGNCSFYNGMSMYSLDTRCKCTALSMMLRYSGWSVKKWQVELGSKQCCLTKDERLWLVVFFIQRVTMQRVWCNWHLC